MGAPVRSRRPVQRAPRAGLSLDRLCAVHVSGGCRREPARRPLARYRQERMRTARTGWRRTRYAQCAEEDMTRAALYPVFLKLEGLPVAVIGGGTVAASKLDGLLAAGAHVTVIAPHVLDSIRG